MNWTYRLRRVWHLMAVAMLVAVTATVARGTSAQPESQKQKARDDRDNRRAERREDRQEDKREDRREDRNDDRDDRSPGRGPRAIDSIVPAQARPGDRVTITGQGFGARNVRILVGTAAAQIVTATGNSATFVVPNAPAGPTTVTATNPGGHTGSIPFRVLLTIVKDEPAAVQAEIGPNGGVLVAQSGGLTYTLTVPALALVEPQTITMTPIAAIPNLWMSGGLVGAVQFAPDGLHFLTRAHLTISAPAGFATLPLGFTSSGHNDDAFAYPSHYTSTTAEFSVFHFSLIGAGITTPAELKAQIRREILANIAQTSTPEGFALYNLAAIAHSLDLGSIDAATARADEIFELLSWMIGGPNQPGIQLQLFRAVRDDELFFNGEALTQWIVWRSTVSDIFGGSLVPPFSNPVELSLIAADGYTTLVMATRNAIAKSNQNCLAQHHVHPYVTRQISIAYLARNGVFGGPEATEFDLDAITANLCVQARITNFTNPPTIPPATPTTFGIDAGAYFTDGVPVQAPDNAVDVDARVSNATFAPASGTVNGPATFTTDVTPNVGAQSVTLLATPSWFLLTGQSNRVVVCVDPAALDPGTGTCVLPVVTIAPASSTLHPGDTVNFTATVAGAPNDFTWSAIHGSIVKTGPNTATYTAGSNPGPDQVDVTNVVFPILVAKAPIVIKLPVTISVTPQNAKVPVGKTLSYTVVVVTGNSNGVTWSAGGGSIVPTGPNTATYTAGSTPGFFSVTATSVNDPSVSQTVAVEVVKSGVVVFAGQLSYRDESHLGGGDRRSDTSASWSVAARVERKADGTFGPAQITGSASASATLVQPCLDVRTVTTTFLETETIDVRAGQLRGQGGAPLRFFDGEFVTLSGDGGTSHVHQTAQDPNNPCGVTAFDTDGGSGFTALGRLVFQDGRLVAIDFTTDYSNEFAIAFQSGRLTIQP